MLPVVPTAKALAILDSPFVLSADHEAVEFFIASGLAKLWKHAYANEEDAVVQARAHVGGDYAKQVRDRFLAEHEAARFLSIPSGLDFRIDGVLTSA